MRRNREPTAIGRAPARTLLSTQSGATSDVQHRAELCQGLVRTIAWQIHCRLPSHIELDDLIGYGQVGLAQAVQDYCPDRGARFETYAYYRIRGAILDGLSQMTWFNLADYHARVYERAAGDLLSLDAADEESGNAEESSTQFTRQATSMAVVYLAAALGGPESDVMDRAAIQPETDAMMDELRRRLRSLIEALPAEAGDLIRNVYFHGMSLQDAAEAMGRSKSWASRLHRRAIERLGRAMRRLTAEEGL